MILLLFLIYHGNNITYSVYKIYEVSPSDISCIIQENIATNELTLVTCNNYNHNRIIVKAKKT